MELVRKDVGVWDEIELAPTEPFLHLDIIEAEAILSGDFIALWEVVDSLELIQTFIEVALAG